MKARRVYFNSACPVCRAGVDRQRKRMSATGNGEDIEWCDVVVNREALDRRLTVDDVRLKLYVEDDEGGLHAGAEAFTALWRETPGLRPLAWFLSLPGISRLAQAAYNCFANRLYAWNRRHGRW